MSGRRAASAGSVHSWLETAGLRHTHPVRPAFYAGDRLLRTGRVTALFFSPAPLAERKRGSQEQKQDGEGCSMVANTIQLCQLSRLCLHGVMLLLVGCRLNELYKQIGDGGA